MEKGAAAARTASGIHVGGSGRDGATIWIAPDHEASASGLHPIEEAHHGDRARGRGDAKLPGAFGTCGDNGASGMRGGMGINARTNARCHERCDSGLGEPAARLAGKLKG